MNGDDDEVVVGRAPTDRDLFYIRMADHLAKESLAVLNHSLRHLATMGAALFAGSIALHVAGVIARPVSAFVTVCLLVSTVISAWALIPYDREADLRCPAEIEDAFRSGIRYKRQLVIAAVLLILLAMLVVCLGACVPPESDTPAIVPAKE